MINSTNNPNNPNNPNNINNLPSTHPGIKRLQNVRFDPITGLYIGMAVLNEQLIRVGIRPLPDGMQPKGPPLLFFNGIGANLELAGALLSALPQVESLIFDVPGAGQSPEPKRPYRPFELVRLTCRLLDQLGYTHAIDVAGVSWGGAIAQQFALQYPKRVRRLILAATSMGGITMVPGHPRVLLKMINPARYRNKDYMQRIAPDLYGGMLRTQPQAIKLFTDHAKGGSSLGYKYQLLAIAGWSSLPWVWRIRHPVLILAGDDDPLIPLINARLMALLLPKAKLTIIHDGHLFMVTQPQLTAEHIGAFLA